MSDGDAGPWFCDFAAGAPADDDVLDEFVAVERRARANPSSVHAPGQRARGELEHARQRIADALELAPSDVVFTSGGTEAANLAVRGLGDPQLPVLLAEVEHPAVWEAAAVRGTQPWQTDDVGRARVAAPTRPVGLICLTHAQSELGTLQPIDVAADLADELSVPLFVDAAQTLGRVALGPVLARGAVMALSPHKAGGLRGHGALVGRDLSNRLRPLLRGGGQELGLRPGTQSPALAAANALAIERAIHRCEARAETMREQRDAFLQGLVNASVPHRVLTPLDASTPSTVMLCFEEIDGRNLLPALDLAGVYASHGSACSSGSTTAPRILAAIGLEEQQRGRCVRFSFGLPARSSTTWRECAVRVGEVTARLLKKN